MNKMTMKRDAASNQPIYTEFTPEEWEARVNLAACYRLVAMYGWDDLIFTHISARVPGSDHHFLINPYGYLFEEITASSLVRIDLDGNIVSDTDAMVNSAGFTIHSAVHGAREDAGCVLHLHTDAGVAVASMADGLLPLTQTALAISNQIAYHDYEGIAFDLSERDRLVNDLQDKNILILRNHGTLAVGRDCGEAFMRMFFLERACAMQVAALGGKVSYPPEVAQTTARTQGDDLCVLAPLAWSALRRKLDRLDPSYKT